MRTFIVYNIRQFIRIVVLQIWMGTIVDIRKIFNFWSMATCNISDPYTNGFTWGRVTHICAGNVTIIGPDNGLSPGRRQAIIWTNAGILLIGLLGTDVSEISIEIIIFSLKKIPLKMSSDKMAAICLGLNELKRWGSASGRS